MSKTRLTKQIETALIKKIAKTKGTYGALEVTLDYNYGRSGYQRCDYVEITNDCQITCYEIKVTWEDLNSNNQLTFDGNRNYLVVPKELAPRIKEEHHFLGATGLIEWSEDGTLKTVRPCRHHTVSFDKIAAITNATMKAASRDFIKLYLKQATDNYGD